MQSINRVKIFFVGILLAASAVQASCLLPVTFKASSSCKEINGHLLSAKVASFAHDHLARTQHAMQSITLPGADIYLQTLQRDIETFSLKEGEKVLDAVKVIEGLLLGVGLSDHHNCQPLHAVVLVKAMQQLLEQAHVASIQTLITLQKHHDYWDQQYLHQNYYFFHRSPLKWFSKSSRKIEIINKKKCIEEAQAVHQRVIGQIALLAAEFDAYATVDAQYEWVMRGCEQLRQIPFLSPQNKDMVTVENCYTKIQFLSSDFSTYNQQIVKKLGHAFMPSHLERNWALYAGAVAAVVGGYLYFRQNPHAIQNGYQQVSDFCVKNYMNHIKDPLRDIRKELSIDRKGNNSAAQQLNQLIDQSVYTKEMEKDLIDDVYTFYRTTNKSLGMGFDEEELRIKSEALDRGYFLRFGHKILSDKWRDGGVLIQGWMSPFSKTTKSKIIDEFPAAGTLLARLTEHKGISFFAGSGKVIFNKFDELEKKLNLMIGVAALFPAAGVLWGLYSGVRSFGSYIVPKGYDDTPVKTYIIKMQNLLDDAMYVGNKAVIYDLDTQAIGILLYYGAMLEKEVEHLSQKNRVVMEQHLEKFYASTGLTGKKVYLEKMLHEYHSWPRFIQR